MLRFVWLAALASFLGGCTDSTMPASAGAPGEPENPSIQCPTVILYLGAEGWQTEAPATRVAVPIAASAGVVTTYPADGKLRLPAAAAPTFDRYNVTAVLYLEARAPVIGIGAPVPVEVSGLPMPLWFPVNMMAGQVAGDVERIRFEGGRAIFGDHITINADRFIHSGNGAGGLNALSDPSMEDIAGSKLGALSRIEIRGCA